MPNKFILIAILIPFYFGCSEKKDTIHEVKIQQPAASSGYVPYYTNPPISEFDPKIQNYLNTDGQSIKKAYLDGDRNVEDVLGTYWKWTKDKKTVQSPKMQALKNKSVRNK